MSVRQQLLSQVARHQFYNAHVVQAFYRSRYCTVMTEGSLIEVPRLFFAYFGLIANKLEALIEDTS